MRYQYRGHHRDDNSSLPDTRTRLIGSAIKLYGDAGFEQVTLRDIAKDAGVSAPLVIHHFGSSAGLREACDHHVAEAFRQAKTEGIHYDGAMPANYVVDAMQSNKHLLKYMLNAFVSGGERMDALLDQLIEDSLEYTAAAEELGLVYPSADPYRRAVLILLHSFGSLMLHKQMKRLIGVDPVNDPAEAIGPYIAGIIELYTQPVINGEVYGLLATIDNAGDPSQRKE